MKTGFRGTFVLSWSQTELDGQSAAPAEALRAGATWAWGGDALRVDGPNDVLQLDRTEDDINLRRRAARKVRRLVGAAIAEHTGTDSTDIDEPLMEARFVITDGIASFTATLIDVTPGQPPLLMFVDELPPQRRELWVVYSAPATLSRPAREPAGGVICFTPGTMIATPQGQRRVEDLHPGDRVLTADDGAQEIQWIGTRRMSGARLMVQPELRPVRIGPGALGIDRPDRELLVSPEHRMLLRGPAAQALFNTSEVLVAARDLVNGTTVTTATAVREVTYVHLLLPSHQIVWANGVECDSFHPAQADLASLGEFDRIRLLAMYPDLDRDPHLYGDFARRSLSRSEAAILRYEAA